MNFLPKETVRNVVRRKNCATMPEKGPIPKEQIIFEFSTQKKGIFLLFTRDMRFIFALRSRRHTPAHAEKAHRDRKYLRLTSAAPTYRKTDTDTHKQSAINLIS